MSPIRINWRIAGLAFVAVIVAVEAIVLSTHWPFTRKAVLRQLAQEAEGHVTIREFHQTFVPRPGFVARGIVLHHGNGNGPPLIAIDRMTVTGSYGALLTFTKHLREIRTEGMHIRIPPKSGDSGASNNDSSSTSIRIDHFVADNAILEFLPRKEGDQPYVLQIHRTILSPASSNLPMRFETALRVPDPPGEVTGKGTFGPWHKTDPFQTPVSGTYTFQNADLGHFSGLAGTLASTGRYDGVIARLLVNGTADVRDFEVRAAQHRIHIEGEFHATVNGHNGDVAINGVSARFLRTSVLSSGEVSSSPSDKPKELALDLAVSQGRIQDLLRLVSSGPPGLSGAVSVRFNVHLPPGDAPFLKRLRLRGEMGVGDGRFRNPQTQESLERLADKAPDPEPDPADVMSDLKGHVAVSGGVARLSGVTFHVTGAYAVMSGTYDLITHRVDLRGNVRLDEKPANATKGIKSLLVKVVEPFFRKRKHLYVVPVRLSGAYGNTSLTLDWSARKKGGTS